MNDPHTSLNPESTVRAKQMEGRVVRTAGEAGATEEETDTLRRAHTTAMAPRLGALADEFDPDLLHPGRSVLILLTDVEETRLPILAAALLVESQRVELRVRGEEIERVLGPEVAELVGSVPLPADEDLAERLVTADESTRLVALAERLDHLRHAHLWPDLPRRAEAHARAVEVYHPVAERTHPTLARRYRWWCRMFARRWLK